MKYKNISKMEQVLIGFGVVGPDKIIKTDKPINNPNFELVSERVTIAKEDSPPKETAPKKVKK